MERMGDVVKKNNNAEKLLEDRIMREAIQKGKLDELREKKQRDDARARDIALIASLDEQMKIKQKQEDFEKKQNAVYIKMVIDQDERDKRNQKNADEKHK